MIRFIIKTLKVAGIAVLYSAAGLILCMTAKAFSWEPSLHHSEHDSVVVWNYYSDLVLVVTFMVAFFAGRSWRPHFTIGGVITGVMASLLFRFVERTQYSPGRGPGLLSTFLAAALFGMIFGLLGAISGSRQKAS